MIVLAAMITLGGCAQARRSDAIIDPTGVDMAQYDKDAAECQQISKQVRRKGAGGAVGGAVVGGALGGIGGAQGGTERGAKAGAVLGGVRGAAATRRERKTVFKNCLRNRGYAVLN
jgi:uncharacterized protein YcfJ